MHAMLKFRVIVRFALVAALIVWAAYSFFVANEGVHYFTSEPQRLLHVAAIAFAGGLLVLAFSRLSPATRHAISLVARGSFAIIVTGYSGVLAYWLTSLHLLRADPGTTLPFVAILVSSVVLAALLWFELYQVWRRKE
jgi:hypothetical protein